MASPTEAEIQDQIGKVCKVFDELRLFGHENATNIIQMEGDLIASLEGDYSAGVASAFATFRASLDSAIRQPASVLAPLLQTYAQFIGSPETDPQLIIDRIVDHMIDNALTVKERDFTFGVPAADGANAGDGVLNRLTLDENADNIENQHADAKIITCLKDEHSGSNEHEEIFEMRGESVLKDALCITGSGRVQAIVAASAAHSQSLVTNPSWDRFKGTVTAVTAIEGWTAGTDITDFDIDQTNYYRGNRASATAGALKFTTNDYLDQPFTVRQAQFNPRVPAYIQVAWNRSVGSGDGTLTLSLGSQDVAVVLAAQAGWQILRLPLDENLWFRNWNEEGLSVRIALTENTTGTVLVDDLILVPMTQFDGAWYALVGGATPFLRDDEFTFSDTEVGAIIQHWFWRAFARYLPCAAVPTWADPTTINPTPTPTPSPTPTPTP